MLFDLRGTGRRRVIKVVYITLAFLMGGGLVLFGIGGGGALPGGLVDAITQGGGGGDDTARDRLREQEQAATAKARANPTERRALGRRRARALQPRQHGREHRSEHQQLHRRGRAPAPCRRAGVGGAPEAGGRQARTRGSRASWSRATPARRARQGDAARRRSSPRTANSAGAYATLATLAYQAGQIRKGDLATDKALELTEPDMREALKGQLESAKTQATHGRAGGSAAPTPTPTPAKTPKPRG